MLWSLTRRVPCLLLCGMLGAAGVPSVWLDVPVVRQEKHGGDAPHYVVVRGLDWQQDVVLKNDPAERKLLKQGRTDFEKEWKAAGYWTLLAVPRQGDPVSAP